MKSENGIFVSEEPAIVYDTFDADPDDKSLYPYVFFDNWRPINQESKGMLYVPTSASKIVSLEIILEEKR